MQTNHFYLALIGAMLAGPLAFSAHAGTVEVRVTGVDNELGKVQVALCDKETFLKQCRYSASAPARPGENVLKVENIPAGTWAVLSFHDENANGELDRNLIGIPKENYGFSRAARGTFGPPSFEQAAITVGEATVVAPVKLR